jgi:predicted nucleotidyltransferase component of viral defense system
MTKFAHLRDWFNLPDETKKRLFTETSRQIGLPSSAASEKDWWVVHTLAAIFSLDCAPALVFKGGTSLSKGWNVIQRFSEDIDLALDREFLGFSGELQKSDIRRLRKRSFEYISEVLATELNSKFSELGFENVIAKPQKVENHNQDPLIIEIYYQKLTENDTYLKPGILVEIGSRSLKEPMTNRIFGTFVSQVYTANPFTDKHIEVPVVNPERTFLEKIFLLHEEFQKPKEKIRVNRLSRHLYDIEKLSHTEFAKIALKDMELYRTIVEHRERFTAISGIDYKNHNPANINFIPPADVTNKWEIDYNGMLESMIYGDKLNFRDIIYRLTELQNKINNIPGVI